MPCWAELRTRDAAAATEFYCELFGWSATRSLASGEAEPDASTYVLLDRDGYLFARCVESSDDHVGVSWMPYFAVAVLAAACNTCVAHGGTVLATHSVEQGEMALLTDPAGAMHGVLQFDGHAGRSARESTPPPCTFHLHTPAFDEALDYYRSAFDWPIASFDDSSGTRYATVTHPGLDKDMVSIEDNSRHIPAGGPARWAAAWTVHDVRASFSRAMALGAASPAGSVEDSRYGPVATLRDPSGVEFNLRASAR